MTTPSRRPGPEAALARARLQEDLIVTGEAVALDIRPTSVGMRVLGGLVDAVAYLLGAVGLLVLAARLLSGLNEAQLGVVQVTTFAVVMVIAPTVIETLTRGRSLGKWATGTRVVRDDGGPVRLRHTLVRALAGVGELWLTAGSVAVVAAAVNRRGKRLGDLLAGTYAVRVRGGARPPAPLAMPPELAAWAAGADIRALPDGLGLSVRTFLGRDSMTPQRRAELGARLAAQVEPFVAPPPPWGTPPERFLTAVLVARRDREYAAGLRAQERERAEAAQIGRLPFEIRG
ncbi:RDD family protein [Georgenia thermotolerans]|uniref:RDD family protein n=1 Tax=Georgenia thermotolerans TaxID=527326 RepID=A0A7J5URN5_9MICO|nr:RDD family protein [Georgenia thermotolerans]KAE8765096.1 RDD family protein [Georgenia thermotolerans]